MLNFLGFVTLGISKIKFLAYSRGKKAGSKKFWKAWAKELEIISQ